MGIENLFRLFPAIFTAILISYISMPVIIQIAGLKKLMDEPDEVRKFHHGIIPTLGGIGIFSAFLISFSIWGDASSLKAYPFLVASLFMLFLIGIKDDILVISPEKKLIVQLLAATELVLAGEVYVDNLGGLFGVYEIAWLPAVVLSTMIIVVLINSYNLIDGIDGLAGGIGIIVSSVLGIWFWGAGFFTMSILSFVLSGSLLGFLFYNMHPAKIFMGDTGAMAVGFIIAFLAFQFINLNQSIVGTEWHIENGPVMVIAIMIIPVIDTFRVAVLRILSGQSPFKADHNHTHHKLIEWNIPPHFASFSLWIANFLIIGFAFLLQNIEANLLLSLVLIAGFSILPVTKFVANLFFGLQIQEEEKEFLVFTNGEGEGSKESRNSHPSRRKPTSSAGKKIREIFY